MRPCSTSCLSVPHCALHARHQGLSLARAFRTSRSIPALTVNRLSVQLVSGSSNGESSAHALQHDRQFDLRQQNRADFRLNWTVFEKCWEVDIFPVDAPPVLKDAHLFFHTLTEEGKYPQAREFQLHTGAVHGWRCRVRLAVRGTSDAPILGLFKARSHEPVEAAQHGAHHPQINAMLEVVRACITEHRVQPYREEDCAGELRYLQLTVTTTPPGAPHSASAVDIAPELKHSTAAQERAKATEVAELAEEHYQSAPVQVVLVWNSQPDDGPSTARATILAEEISRRCNKLDAANSTRPPSLHSVWINYQPGSTNTIVGREWTWVSGERWLWERPMGPGRGCQVAYSPGSFMQANTCAAQRMIRLAAEHVPPGSHLVELYAGVGAIGLCLAAEGRVRRLRCVEINPEVRTAFQRSVQELPSGVAASVEMQVESADSRPAQWLEGADAVLVDPPRSGLHPPVLQALAGDMAKGTVLIYISCGWPALKRDVRELTKNGLWEVVHAEAIQFFPGTNHMETLCVLQRTSVVLATAPIDHASEGRPTTDTDAQPSRTSSGPETQPSINNSTSNRDPYGSKSKASTRRRRSKIRRRKSGMTKRKAERSGARESSTPRIMFPSK